MHLSAVCSSSVCRTSTHPRCSQTRTNSTSIGLFRSANSASTTLVQAIHDGGGLRGGLSDDMGDPELQDGLVKMIKVQIEQEAVKSTAEEQRERLREAAEKAKEDVDRLHQLTLDRSNLAFGSALADIDQMGKDFEEELRRSREASQAASAELELYEEQLARDRSQGHFFQSLYRVKKQKKPDDSPSISVQAESRLARDDLTVDSKRPTKRPTRTYLFTFLAGALAAFVAADLVSESPSPAQDVLYAVIATSMAIVAWNQRDLLPL